MIGKEGFSLEQDEKPREETEMETIKELGQTEIMYN